MKINTYPYDAAEFLVDEETICGYLSLAAESRNPEIIAKAVDAATRARNRSISKTLNTSTEIIVTRT